MKLYQQDNFESTMQLMVSGCPIPLLRPSDKGATLIRPLPAFDSAGVRLPWRTGFGKYDVSEWLAVVSVADYWGTTPMTFLDYPTDQHDKFPTAPAQKTYDVLKQAVDSGNSQFAPLLTGKTSVKRPGRLAYVQAIVYQEDGQALRPPLVKLVQIKTSGLIMLELILNSIADDKPRVDPVTEFTCGDLLHPQTGKAWVISAYTTDPTSQVNPMFLPKTQQKSKKSNLQTRYKVDLVQDRPAPLPDEIARKYWLPWERVLRLCTRREIWGFVCKAIGPVATGFVGQDEPENLPASCVQIAQQYRAYGMGQAPAPSLNPIPQNGGPEIGNDLSMDGGDFGDFGGPPAPMGQAAPAGGLPQAMPPATAPAAAAMSDLGSFGLPGADSAAMGTAPLPSDAPLSVDQLQQQLMKQNKA